MDIKEIIWKEQTSDFSGSKYFVAYVRDFGFLTLQQHGNNKDFYYIHTVFPTFTIKGNKGIEEWGYMQLEEAKQKSEEIIKEEILSFLK